MKDLTIVTMLDLTVFQVLVLATVAMAIIVTIWRRSWQKSEKCYLTPNAPRDRVILQQYGPGLTVPSVSPFVMKLETYLRAAKIPYDNKFNRRPGPKQKLPWIQYNDKIVCDSQFCIDFLNAELQVDLNKRLKPDQIALGHVIRRTAEESLYQTLLMWRLVFEPACQIYQKLGLPHLFIWYMRRTAKDRLWWQGIGRHTEQEVTQIMEEDLSAISLYLGERNFLFGDKVEEVTEADCALFGQLCQLVWQMPGCPVEALIAEKYPNLVRYCVRMKEAFWPDWNQRLKQPVGIPDAKNAQEITDAVNQSESRSLIINGDGAVTSHSIRQQRQNEALTSRSPKVCTTSLVNSASPYAREA